MGKGIGGLYCFSVLVSTTCQCEEGIYLFLMATTPCRTIHMHFVLLRLECVIWNLFVLCFKNKVIVYTHIQIGIKHILCTLLKTLTMSFLEAIICYERIKIRGSFLCIRGWYKQYLHLMLSKKLNDILQTEGWTFCRAFLC